MRLERKAEIAREEERRRSYQEGEWWTGKRREVDGEGGGRGGRGGEGGRGEGGRGEDSGREEDEGEESEGGGGGGGGRGVTHGNLSKLLPTSSTSNGHVPTLSSSPPLIPRNSLSDGNTILEASLNTPSLPHSPPSPPSPHLSALPLADKATRKMSADSGHHSDGQHGNSMDGATLSALLPRAATSEWNGDTNGMEARQGDGRGDVERKLVTMTFQLAPEREREIDGVGGGGGGGGAKGREERGRSVVEQLDERGSLFCEELFKIDKDIPRCDRDYW